MRKLAVALALFATLSISAQSKPADSPERRLAAQNALFEEFWQTSLKLNPTQATAVGDYRYNDKLGDNSLAAVVKRNAMNVAYLAKIKAIKTDGFSEEDRTSHDLFLRNMQENVDDFDLKNYEMPVTAQAGVHTGLADLPNAVPLDSVKHYEDYIARLHQIPNALMQTEDVLRAGVKDHLVIVKFVAEKIPQQCAGIIAANPFLNPIKKMPADFSDADKKRLADAITAAVNTEVLPAYKQFASFITSEYAPHGRSTLSIESLPDGKRRYQAAIRRLTTTNLSPAEIHRIGLAEFDRIVGEMTALAKANGYADLASFREHIESDPKYKPSSSQAIVDDFDRYIKQMRPKLPELFNVIPSAPVTVEAIPEFQKAAATHYQTGTPDGKRPGRVSVAVSDYASRSFINDEAVAYHEGIPGHHMQLSIQQTLKGLPEFRKHGGNSAYAEGWALYAEQLGKEVGFYQDPGSDYGRLRSELFRAVRLVVDTGIHSKRWSREQATDYMVKTTGYARARSQREVERYCTMIGQACSYKVGHTAWIRARDEAKKRLGAKFDIRQFHEVLREGAMPLSILERRIRERTSAVA